MIVRILGAGQWRVDDSTLDELNAHDDKVQAALDAGDQSALTAALAGLLGRIRQGQEVPDSELSDSDLIVPDESATLDEVRSLLDESGSTEGLIPG